MPVTNSLIPKLLGRLPRLSRAVLSDMLSVAGEMPPPGLPWLPKTGRLWNSTGPREPAHVGDCGPRIHTIDPATGQLAVEFRLYLPPAYGTHVQIRGPFTSQQWHDMESTPGDESLWRYAAEQVLPGSPYDFRFWGHDGNWREVTDPMAYVYTKQFDAATGQFDHYAVVPDLDYVPAVPRPLPDSALAIFECTFAGLLTHWDAGRYFPQHPTCRRLAERVRCSGVIARLREEGYNAVLLPIQISAADLFHSPRHEPGPVSGPGAIDPQIGDWSDVKALVDEFHRRGLVVIPDVRLSRLTRDASVRGIDQLDDPRAGPLWFDPQTGDGHQPATGMVNLRDRQIRAHLIEVLIRFVRELNLVAIRLADAEELLQQYAAEETNYGWLWLQELQATLAAYGQPVLCLGGSPRLPQVLVGQELLPASCQDSASVATVDQLLAETAEPDQGQGGGVQATPSRDGRALPPRILDQAQSLLQSGQLPPGEVLEFVACRTALLEALTMFAGPAAYAMRAGAADYLPLDSHPATGVWQAIWSVEEHPDVEAWAARTGLSAAAVRRRIGRHADLMRRLRKLFVARTAFDRHGPKLCPQVTRLDTNGPAATLLLTWQHPTDSWQDLLLAFNFSRAAARVVSSPLPPRLAGSWRPLILNPESAGQRDDDFRVVPHAEGGVIAEYTLPAHALRILDRDALV